MEGWDVCHPKNSLGKYQLPHLLGFLVIFEGQYGVYVNIKQWKNSHGGEIHCFT